MSKTKKVNRMFLALILFYIAGSFGISYLNLIIPIPDIILDSQGELLILLPTVLYLVIIKQKPNTFIQHEPMHPVNYLFIILLAYLSMPLMSVLNLFSMQVSENYVSEMMLKMMKNPFAYNLIMIAVLPCLIEEFVFRGVLFHTYREKGILKAAFVSGLLFGLLHLNINQFSYAFVLGVAFALLIEATGSIWSSVLFHFVINTHSLVMSTISVIWLSTQMPEQDLTQAEQELQMAAKAMMESPAYIGIQIVSIAFVILMAIGTTALYLMLYKYLAKRCGRWNYIKGILKGQGTEKLEEGMEKREIKKRNQVLDIPLFLSIFICVCFIVYQISRM